MSLCVAGAVGKPLGWRRLAVSGVVMEDPLVWKGRKTGSSVCTPSGFSGQSYNLGGRIGCNYKSIGWMVSCPEILFLVFSDVSYLRQVANVMAGNVFHHKLLNLDWHYLLICQYPTQAGSYISIRKSFLLSKCCIFALFVQLLVLKNPKSPGCLIFSLFSLCSDTINEGLFHGLLMH